MNKILAIICIILPLYIGSVFLIPETADMLASKIGLKEFNQSIRGIKKIVDSSISLPEATGGILDVYQSTVNEAKQVKEIYEKGLEQGKEVKQKIDTLRATLSGAQDTVNKTIETANTVLETGKEIQNKIGEVKNTFDDINTIGKNIDSVINTGAIK